MAQYTVYPKKYAHGFVVLCFVVVMQSFIMNSHEVFIHIHQGCFAGTGAIVRLPQCQWSKPDGYGKISQCITTTKHSKAKTVCIFLGVYCMCSTLICTVVSHLKLFASWVGFYWFPKRWDFSFRRTDDLCVFMHKTWNNQARPYGAIKSETFLWRSHESDIQLWHNDELWITLWRWVGEFFCDVIIEQIFPIPQSLITYIIMGWVWIMWSEQCMAHLSIRHTFMVRHT